MRVGLPRCVALRRDGAREAVGGAGEQVGVGHLAQAEQHLLVLVEAHADAVKGGGDVLPEPPSAEAVRTRALVVDLRGVGNSPVPCRQTCAMTLSSKRPASSSTTESILPAHAFTTAFHRRESIGLIRTLIS